MPLAKMVTVFFTSALLLKVAVGGAIAMQLNFWETLLSAGSSCVINSFIFTYLFYGLLKVLFRYLDKKFPNRNQNRKKFTWKNRIIIRSKRNFGLVGIALISPVLISIPLGAFLGVRFFGDRGKVFLYLSISSLLWITLLYAIFGGWLIVRQ